MLDKPEHAEELREVSALFDDAFLLGSRLHEKQSSISMEADDYVAMQSIMRRARQLEDIEVVYSGMGFVPVVDPEGELITGYKEVDGARGLLGAIYVSDPEDMAYVSPKHIVLGENSDDDEAGAVSMLPDALRDMQKFKESLSVAPEGFTLFVEFIMLHHVDVDTAIRGQAVRTTSYTVYNIMDAADLKVLDISKRHKPEQILEPHEIERGLKMLTDHYRQSIRTKKFRNYTANSQSKIIETFLQRSNEVLQLDRFMVYAKVDMAYAPDSDDPKGFKEVLPFIHFQGRCLRLDCVETKLLSEGNALRKRKGNVNSIDSTCVVVEIEDDVAEFMGLKSNVLWLPVTSQLKKMEFVELGLRV